jgi:hypothetical protein
MVDNALCIWSASSPNGRRNLQVGLETQTWGFKDSPAEIGHPRWVLFGHDHSNGSPRVDATTWQRGELEVILCEFTVPFYVGHSPHWPDEIEANTVIYPHRFGLTPVASLRVDASPDGPLGAGSEGLRSAAIQNRGVLATLDVEPLLDAMGVPLVAPSQTDSDGPVPDLGRTPGQIRPSFPPVRGRRGAGRSHDPEFNRTVEQRAVTVAEAYLRDKLGWTDIQHLGKPYDLVCRKESGQEKHVEVKGTTGAGADVEYTPNEVRHFRTCPHGADLIVVRDIAVDRSTTPYTATGGELLHVANYTAPPEHLQATGWLGRVSGWDTA